MIFKGGMILKDGVWVRAPRALLSVLRDAIPDLGRVESVDLSTGEVTMSGRQGGQRNGKSAIDVGSLMSDIESDTSLMAEIQAAPPASEPRRFASMDELVQHLSSRVEALEGGDGASVLSQLVEMTRKQDAVIRSGTSYPNITSAAVTVFDRDNPETAADGLAAVLTELGV